MSKNIDIQLNEINRLINYDRSKTITEQEKEPVGQRADVEVGPISVSPLNTIETERYKKEDDISGKSFGYPEYCGSPSYAISGDESHPAYPDWCMYQSPNGVMYFPKNSKVKKVIENDDSWADLFGAFLDTPVGKGTLDDYFDKIGGLRGEETERRLRNEFYDSITKIYPVGSVVRIEINGKKYEQIQ